MFPDAPAPSVGRYQGPNRALGLTGEGNRASKIRGPERDPVTLGYVRNITASVLSVATLAGPPERRTSG